MSRIIDIRLPAAEGNVWADDAPDSLVGKMTIFEVDAIRVMVKVIAADVDPSDSGYLLMKLQMPKERK